MTITSTRLNIKLKGQGHRTRFADTFLLPDRTMLLLAAVRQG